MKNINLCKIEGCNKSVHAKGLCKSHYNHYDRSGEVAGVYKIILKDVIYIGYTYSGMLTRMSNHKSNILGDKSTYTSEELLKYFNMICEEEGIAREEAFDKYFDYAVLESSPRWHKVDENFNTIPYKGKAEQKELTFGANISTDSEMQRWNELGKEYWEGREAYWINYYKRLDIENRTNICMNVK
ncbi:hypothetical protein KPL47_09825 [Clostridium estertheticum]|uniref:hypothetical protein n=1 Tax=Clostridium estertheticum TaxID=238834 RepID=UPI001C0E7721|nr:hypothetical protein [Clostridium estertheticum]MBU3176670.1 hypothetical protein [Clostridium estertheticum]